jgi:hypothetical protein
VREWPPRVGGDRTVRGGVKGARASPPPRATRSPSHHRQSSLRPRAGVVRGGAWP